MPWNGHRIALATLIAWLPASRCLAGESFLDRNAKGHEALPYGRSVGETPAPANAAAAGRRREDALQDDGPLNGTPSSLVEEDRLDQP